MASAAKSIQASPIAAETGPIALPGAAEMFAALVAGAGNERDGSAAGEQAPVEAQAEDATDPALTVIDASVLLPMLDQQRAAAPAAKLVSEPVVMTAKAKLATKGVQTPAAKPVDADPVSRVLDPKVIATSRRELEPSLTDGKATAMVTAAPAEPVEATPPIEGAKQAKVVTTDPPVMRVPHGAKTTVPASTDTPPVLRPLHGKGVKRTDTPPVMRTVNGKGQVPVDTPPVLRASKGDSAALPDNIPVMRAIGAKSVDAPTPAPTSKPAPANPAPVMRVLDGGKQASNAPVGTSPVMRPIESPPVAAAVQVPAPVAADKPQPAMSVIAAALPLSAAATQPIAAKAPAKPVATQPASAKIAAPEVQVVAVEAQASPVVAKARTGRIAAPPADMSTEANAGSEPLIAATAAEARAAVHPLTAAQPLVQPAGAPIAGPVQNVAAALSQQVLDMSAGDQWIEQAARDIAQASAKDGAMRFRLAPETLGELKVEITQSERGAHVRLNVSTEAAQQALVAAEPKLTAEARIQGVRIAETEINFTGGQGHGRDASAHAREQGQQQPQHSQQPRGSRSGSANSFSPSASVPEGRGRNDRYA